MLMFIFSLVIGAITLGTLILGMVGDRGVCYPLRHPGNSKVLSVVDDYIVKSYRFRDAGLDISASTILNLCYNNESIYKVFNLANKFNVDDLAKQFNVSSILDTIENQLDKIVDPHFTILNNTNINILRNLSRFDPGINFDHFQDEVSFPMKIKQIIVAYN